MNQQIVIGYDNWNEEPDRYKQSRRTRGEFVFAPHQPVDVSIERIANFHAQAFPNTIYMVVETVVETKDWEISV